MLIQEARKMYYLLCPTGIVRLSVDRWIDCRIDLSKVLSSISRVMSIWVKSFGRNTDWYSSSPKTFVTLDHSFLTTFIIKHYLSAAQLLSILWWIIHLGDLIQRPQDLSQISSRKYRILWGCSIQKTCRHPHLFISIWIWHAGHGIRYLSTWDQASIWDVIGVCVLTSSRQMQRTLILSWRRPRLARMLRSLKAGESTIRTTHGLGLGWYTWIGNSRYNGKALNRK